LAGSNLYGARATARRGVRWARMHPPKPQVKSGPYDATKPLDGQVILVDEDSADDERAALHSVLNTSIAEADAGDTEASGRPSEIQQIR
jgi:hypothetical protein